MKEEENRQIEKLAFEVLCEWEEEKEEHVRQLEDAYERSVKTVGEGHTEADEAVCQPSLLVVVNCAKAFIRRDIFR